MSLRINELRGLQFRDSAKDSSLLQVFRTKMYFNGNDVVRNVNKTYNNALDITFRKAEFGYPVTKNTDVFSLDSNSVILYPLRTSRISIVITAADYTDHDTVLLNISENHLVKIGISDVFFDIAEQHWKTFFQKT